MNKKFFVSLALLATALFSTESQADLLFSNSNSNPLAGNVLNLEEGATGSLYTWVSGNAAGNNLIGLAFSVAESAPDVVSANAHVITNGGRWIAANGGQLNTTNLITDSASAGVPGTGIVSTGPTDFVLHSEIQLTASGIGSSTLSFTPHSNPGNGIQFQGVTGNQFANTTRGTAIVNVSAIPEPGAFAALAVMGMGLLARRRRNS